MTDEPLDLSPLAPSDEARERVVAAALDRIGERPSSPQAGAPLWRLALDGAAPFALPALAAAALVVLLALGRQGGDPEGASPAVPLMTEPPGPWSAWMARSAAPSPEQILVTFTRDSP